MPTALKRTYDRKTTTLAAGKRDLRAKVGNAFGLPAGITCPGATPACLAVCYAGKVERIFKAAGAVVLANYDALKDATYAGMVELLSDMVSDFLAECEKYGSAKIFRIHWDGDFFSDTYSQAWADVIKTFPAVKFWTYTRVESAALILQGIPNLSLYFSADVDNMPVAKRLASQGIKMAVMSDTFATGTELQRELTGKRGVACPEQKGNVPLISENGGACSVCRACVDGNIQIRFSTTKR